MTLTQIEEYLRAVRTRPADPTPEDVKKALARLKRAALDLQDEDGAKQVWCLERAHAAQTLYIAAFTNIKNSQFYDAWCELERAEITLRSLESHAGGGWSNFHLDFVEKYIRKWQTLFPYKVFLSPEMIELEVECSICGSRVMPRSPCGHIVGDVYHGEMCCRILTKMEPLGVAMVKNPVQKYSVIFTTDRTGERRDQYNYGLVQYAIMALRRPFDEWETDWTTRRQPHSYFRGIGRNDPCPCESKRKYKKCCLPQEGVLRPHVEFTFSVPPPEGMPSRGFVQ